MHFTKTVAALFTLTVAASAIPTKKGGNGGNSGVSCPTNSSPNCCQSTQTAKPGGVLDILSPVLLGINCTPIVSILNILNGQCNAQTVCCQNNPTATLINVGCVIVPIQG
ncbi:MAG: hypothetical protein M1816_006968 [Peltula sp. TS41687]|nr:MAG: hypothetical protein M1816_006968 [Peltula sp. TS41687]